MYREKETERWKGERQNNIHTILILLQVAIVGRSGCGKSSIINAIFRFTDTDCCTGLCSFGGIPIQDWNLQQLRQNILLVPQQPFVFAGTVLENLDPYSTMTQWRSDSMSGKGRDVNLADAVVERMWAIIDELELRSICESMLPPLKQYLTEGGGNLSAGQRQFLALVGIFLFFQFKYKFDFYIFRYSKRRSILK